MEVLSICYTILSLLLINGKHGVNGDGTSTANNVINKLLDDFREYCPYTRLCNTSAEERFNPVTEIGLTSCCKSCDCGIDCGLDCCPDRSAHFESEEEMHFLKNVIQCVDAQYMSDRNDSEKSFLMVSRCPYAYADVEISAKCAREYSEVALNVPLRYILPCYDNYTRLIYKNIFCARCHSVQENTLEFFRLKFKYSLETQNVTYVNDIAQCNMWFKSPDKLPIYQNTCKKGVIRHCNVTGQWEIYDKYLEEACLTYTSVYKNFRNVHCFLCNGFNASDITTLCHYSIVPIPVNPHTFGFITVLDWSKELPTMLGNGSPYEAKGCLQNIFNISWADKWLTSCPDGMVLLKKTCIFPYNISSPLYSILEINLILEPKLVSEDKNKYANSINRILSDVMKEVLKVMSLLVSKDLQFFKVTGFVAFKNNENSLHQSIVKFNMKSVQSISLKIQILRYMSTKMDLFETAIDFALVLTNISAFGYFNARLHHFNKSSVLDEWPSLSCTPDLEQQGYELCFHYPQQTNKELYFTISKIDLHTPVNMSYYTIATEPEPFCPRVALPKPFMCNEPSVKNIYSNKFLNKSLSENETHMFFCYQDYFQHLVNLNVEFDELEPIPLANTRVLFYLTIACLVPSLTCLVLTLTVYSFYSILRTLPGLNNMALVASLILFQTMALLNTVFKFDLHGLCAFVGIFTHFSLILSFAWMFLCTFHMLNVFVKTRNQNVARNVHKTFFSYIAFTIGVAVTAVISVVVAEMVQSGSSDIGYGGDSCYIKKPIIIVFAVAVPVAIVSLTNIVMFGVVVFKIRKSPALASSNIKERNSILIFVKLSTITGMTWVFGFIYIFTRLDAFAYIFIALNAGQGVFIMLSFICNRRVLNLVLKNTMKQSTRRMTSTPL